MTTPPTPTKRVTTTARKVDTTTPAKSDVTPEKKTIADGSPPASPGGAIDLGTLVKRLEALEKSKSDLEKENAELKQEKFADRSQVRRLGIKSDAEFDPLMKAPEKFNEAQVKSGALTPKDLMKYEGPLFVKNNSSTVISHDDGTNYMRLGPSHSSEAYASLPLSIARHPGFQRMWRRGLFTVSADPEMEDELVLAEALISKREQEEREKLSAAIDQSQESKDLHPTSCLKCGNVTFQTKEAQDTAPPLCNDHKNLSSMYVAETYYDSVFLNSDKTRGAERVRWNSPSITPTKVASR